MNKKQIMRRLQIKTIVIAQAYLDGFIGTKRRIRAFHKLKIGKLKSLSAG